MKFSQTHKIITCWVIISYYGKVNYESNKIFKPTYVPHLQILFKKNLSNIARLRHKNGLLPVFSMSMAILDFWHPSWMGSCPRGTRIILWLFVNIPE